MGRMTRLILWGALALTLSPGCQCQRGDLEAKTMSAYPVPGGFYATDQVELEDIRDFYKTVFGTDSYETNWSELDKLRTGSVDTERFPYVDTWYPERENGTNRLGALTKYDLAFHNGESKAAKWENEKHSRQEPYWYGHCNGTSVAGTRYQSPKNSVKRPKGCSGAGCVEFSPADIRALLSEMNMNAKAKFISGRRCSLPQSELTKRPATRTNPQVMDACDDVNPGSFHVGLVNFLGRMKQPIIFDQKQNEEVWNYPIYKYRYNVSGPMDEGEAIAALQLGERIDSWVFNPKARSWYKVTLTVSFRLSTTEVPQNAGQVPGPTEATYEYILELDGNGDVIGGEWVGKYRVDHPDFIWMPFEPLEPTGDDSRGNPFVSNDEVTKLWAESVGFNPEDPFHDKPKNSFDIRFFPPGDLTWGVVKGYYRILLDGRSTGSLFLGKKSHVRVEVADVLKTDASVEVSLNGKVIGNGSPENGRLDLTFDSSPGINFLNLRWNSTKVESSELNWDFRYYAM